VRTGLEAARDVAAVVLVLVVRGLALWVLVPAVFVLWLVLSPVRWVVHGSGAMLCLPAAGCLGGGGDGLGRRRSLVGRGRLKPT
jgi:hypothetical protein